MHMYVAIGSGAVAISTGFLVKIFYAAWRDQSLRDRRRYKVVTAALMTGKVGLFMWAINPLSWAFGFGVMPPWWMVVSSALVLAAASTLIGSTAMGGTKSTLVVFLICCTIWTMICLIWWSV